MNQYKLMPDNPITKKPATSVRLIPDYVIPFDPANTDYQRFKSDVTAGAELQDADGVAMTHDTAVEYIKTLP